MDKIQIKFKKLHTDTLPQPNRVTEMRYATNGIEENMFILVMEALKQHMTGEKLTYEDLWGEPIFHINLKEIDPNNKPNKVFARLKKMQDRKFGYDYTSPQDGKTVEVYGVVFTTLMKKGNDVEVHINKHAIPWLTYIEKGITYYSKTSALSLKGGHTKRLYKYLCSWKSSGGVDKNLYELKEMLDMADKYPKLLDLKRFVLNPARDEMMDNPKSDIWFEYSTFASGENGRKHDYVTFKIHTRYKANNELLEELRQGVSPEHFAAVFNFLQYCIGQSTSTAQDIAGACAQEGDRFMNQRYIDAKKMWSEPKPKAFNFFMSSAQKNSDNLIFKKRFKDASEDVRKRKEEDIENSKKAAALLKNAHQNIGKN